MLDSLDQTMTDAQGEAGDRSVVLQVTLTGRGGLYSALQRQSFIESLLENLNGDWEGRSPFVWCERIEDNTGAPFNRQERIEGSDFLAELLKTVGSSKERPRTARSV